MSGHTKPSAAPRRRLFLVAAGLAAVVLAIVPHRIAAQSARAPDLAAIDRAWSDGSLDVERPGAAIAFVPPSETEIPNDVFGDMVRRGIAIFTDTRNEAKPYAGDGLNCSSCHLDRGRRPGAAPMWAAWVRYPRFRSKNDAVNTMTMRIQGCFRFSMNGAPPPDDSDIMTALQTYFYWLARGAPTGGRLAGAGFTPLAEPAEAPSIGRGAAVFAGKCAACHGSDGRGPPGRRRRWLSVSAAVGTGCLQLGSRHDLGRDGRRLHPRQHALWAARCAHRAGGLGRRHVRRQP